MKPTPVFSPEITRMETQIATLKNDFMEFSYIVSHDLQGSLREAVSFARLLDNKYKDVLDERAKTYISHIIHGGMRAQAMLEGLLAYSRVNTLAKPRVRLDSKGVLNDCLFVLKDELDSLGATIEITEPMPMVDADVDQLGGLFMFLLDNAMKYRKQDTPLHIRIAAEEIAGGAMFWVTDNGSGIAPEHYDRIFRVFGQLDPRANPNGVGMGLALAKKIAERHGGRIGLESEPGKGSTFWFTLEEVPDERREAA